MRVPSLCVFLCLSAPWSKLAEPLIYEVKEGEQASVDGWLYPQDAHEQVVGDLAACDALIPGLEAQLSKEQARADTTLSELKTCLIAHTDAPSAEEPPSLLTLIGAAVLVFAGGMGAGALLL